MGELRKPLFKSGHPLPPLPNTKGMQKADSEVLKTKVEALSIGHVAEGFAVANAVQSQHSGRDVIHA